MTHYACKLCIAMYGLKGADIDQLPTTREEVEAHIRKEHHFPLRSALWILERHFCTWDNPLIEATARVIEQTGPVLEVSKLSE